jgi:hypothetical protein
MRRTRWLLPGGLVADMDFHSQTLDAAVLVEEAILVEEL